jgi:hypothetical protein
VKQACFGRRGTLFSLLGSFFAAIYSPWLSTMPRKGIEIRTNAVIQLVLNTPKYARNTHSSTCAYFMRIFLNTQNTYEINIGQFADVMHPRN